MRKLTLYFLIFLLFVSAAQAQLMQASLGPGTASNRLKIYIKSDVSQSPTVISTLQFNIAIPSGIMPKPNLSVVGNMTATFLGIDWRVDQITEGGYYNYYITTPVSPIQFNLVAGTEYEVMEVQFTGGTATTNASLLSHVDGGSNLNLLFLCTGTVQSNGANLYYSRPGITVNNQLTYDINGAVSGVAISSATLGGVTLPVRWLSFSANRQINDGLISWTVDNDATNEKYIVERSVDGSNFSPIGEVVKRGGTGIKRYDLVDKNIASLGAKIVYYRVKSVEADNRFAYTAIKNIRLDLKGQISLYPIPARDGFTLNIPYLNPNQEKVQLHLINAVGQVIERKDITRLAAFNYYYNLQSSLMTSGEYLLKIFEDGQLTETKRVLIKK